MENVIEDTNEQEMDYFSCLCDDLIVKIFQHLQDSKRHHCLGFVVPLVCRRWNTLSKDLSLWHCITLNSDTMSTNQILSVIQSTLHLEALELQNVQELDPILGHVLASCQRLRCLKIDSQEKQYKNMSPFLLRDILYSIISIKFVEHLSLRGTYIYERDILILCQQLPNLTSLELSQVSTGPFGELSSTYIDHVADHLTCLQVLKAPVFEHWIARRDLDRRISHLLDKRKHQFLQLHFHSRNISDNTLIGINNCNNLVKLSIVSRTELLTNDFLKLISSLPKLSFLQLIFPQYRHGTTEAGWNYFLDQRTCSLKALDIGFCKAVTDDILEKLAIKNPQLYYIRLLSLNDAITDKGLAAVVSNCLHLEVLVLHNLSKISTNPLLQTAHKLPKLTAVKLTDCQSVTKEDLKHLRRLDVPILDCPTTVKDPFGNMLCGHFTSDLLLESSL